VDAGDFIAGIDHDGLSGVFVAHDGAIALQWADGKRFEDHVGIVVAWWAPGLWLVQAKTLEKQVLRSAYPIAPSRDGAPSHPSDEDLSLGTPTSVLRSG
jgi:hypothetical protein